MNKKTHSAAGHRLIGWAICTIIPSHMLREIAARAEISVRQRALDTLQHSERLRGRREMLASLGAVALATPAGAKRRTVYDLKHTTQLPGTLVRGEGSAASKDIAVKSAWQQVGVI